MLKHYISFFLTAVLYLANTQSLWSQASIGNFVWNDLNASGIFIRKHPLAG